MILSVVVVGLVAYRLWRLLALDSITSRQRVWVFGADHADHVFGRRRRAVWKFLLCPWCSGFWLAGLVSLVWHQGVSTEFVWVWVGSSVIVGLVGERS